MDEILERIYRARVEMLRRNETPTAVYLGRLEYATLRMFGQNNGAITRRGLTVDGRDKVFGMDLFEVDATNHLRVV